MATRAKPHRVVTLTTDFGLEDHYAGTMKGVILGIRPDARIVDITHQVSPYQVAEAAYLIAQSYRYFPPKTVHVGVVDPGVGTSRRPILIEAAGQYFVGPDNGIFAMVQEAEPKFKVRVITSTRHFLPVVSQTFHGRDIFAPVAAHLAAGVPPARFGKLIQDFLRLPPSKPERTARRGWTGTVLKVDRFGNLITNFHSSDFPSLPLQAFEMQVGLQVVHDVVRSYEEGAVKLGHGAAFLIAGSSGYYEVSANQMPAAKRLGCGVGTPVELRILSM